jgi:hypothetical protein
MTNKNIKRIVSALLGVVVLCGTMFVMPVSAASKKATITFDYCYGAMRS